MSSEQNRKKTMNEIQTNEFDYSLIDEKLASKLKKYDEQLNMLYHNYTIEVGEVLYNAQQEFSNPRDGMFIKWIVSKGFKRQNAYNYINIYETFQSLESIEQKDVFLKQSKSTQIEMSKPSAKEEVNEAVFDGDIRTHKEYKKMEQRLRKAEQENKELRNRAPEIKEVDKTDYERIELLEKELAEKKDEILHVEKQQDELKLLKQKLEKTNGVEKELKEVKKELEEKQVQLDTLSMEQVKTKNKRLIYQNVSYLTRDIGGWIRRTKQYINERNSLSGDPEIHRTIEGLKKTLQETLDEVSSWTEVEKDEYINNSSEEIQDVEYEIIN